jgi:hypothetical protein
LLGGCERDEGGNAGGLRGFEAYFRAEAHGIASIQHDENRWAAFFAELLDVWFASAGGNAPVDEARFVAGLVGAAFGVIQPCTAIARGYVTGLALF